MSALVYGGRSPIALEICKQLAGTGHEVHLVTRVRDEAIVALAKENGCSEVHECNLEDSAKSIELALKIDSQVGGLDALAFAATARVTNVLASFANWQSIASGVLNEVPGPIRELSISISI